MQLTSISLSALILNDGTISAEDDKKSSLRKSLTSNHKDFHLDVLEAPSNSVITMKLIHAPPSIKIRSSSCFNNNRIQLNVRNTEIVITDGVNSTPLITLNYPQIIKWTILEKECLISLHYTKSHYNGEVKRIQLRTNVKKDSEGLLISILLQSYFPYYNIIPPLNHNPTPNPNHL